MARKAKYGKKSLAEAVERYFASITRTIPVMEKKDSGEKDKFGHTIYELKAVVNNLGEIAMITEYIVPPTVSGLCQYLGIHRSTWSDYCDSKTHPEFSDTTKRARGLMRAYLEQELLTRKDVRGIIFDLQNNHNCSDRTELELGPTAGAVLSAGSMPLEERKKILEQIARDYGSSE